MTLVKQNPYHFGGLIDEIFQSFPATWGKDVAGFAIPPANIHETADAYHVELSVPGRNKEDFSIQVENGLLTISFEKKEETEKKDYKTIRKEFSSRSFMSFCLSLRLRRLLPSICLHDRLCCSSSHSRVERLTDEHAQSPALGIRN